MTLDIEAIRIRRHIAAGVVAVAELPELALGALRATVDDVPLLLAEIERQRKEIAWITSAQHDELRAAGADLRAAEAERNDALQVIADLRGAP